MISNITFFGKDTNRYLYCKSLLLDFLRTFCYRVNIQEISSIEEMMNCQISSIPSVDINGTFLSISRMDLVEDFVLRCIALVVCRVPNPQLTVIRIPYRDFFHDLQLFDQFKGIVDNKIAVIYTEKDDAQFQNLLHVKHVERSSPSFMGSITNMSNYIPVLGIKKYVSCVTHLSSTRIELTQEDWKKQITNLKLSPKSHTALFH